MTSDDKTDPPERDEEPTEAAPERPAEPEAQAADDAAEAPASADQAAEDGFFREGEASTDEQDSVMEEVDLELIRLPKPKRRRHPVVCLVVIALSLYLMYYLRADLMFFFQPRTPTDMGQVHLALQKGTLKPNTYVKLNGVPDRKRTARLEASFGHDNFFPLIRASGKVYVQTHIYRRNPDREVRFTHVGQLVKLDSLPYRKNLKAFLVKTIPAKHVIGIDELRRGRKAGGDSAVIKDSAGAQVKLGPDAMLWINATLADEYWVQFNLHKCPDQEQAALQVAPEGLPVAAETETSRLFWRFVVRATPAKLRYLTQKYGACRRRAVRHSPLARVIDAGPAPDAGPAGASDAGVAARVALKCCAAGEVVPRTMAFTAHWNQLGFDGETLLIDSLDETFPTRYAVVDGKLKTLTDKVVRLPVAAVKAMEISRPFQVPADAMVLLTDKEPGDNWYYALLYVVLLIFMGINGAILNSAWRRRQGQ